MNNQNYKNEILFPDNQLIKIKKSYNIAQCTIKIILPDNSIGSGFFLKFERNNKLFYCLMTNQHVINPEIVKKKKEITIYYNNEQKSLTILLDDQDRIIVCFKEILNIDVTLIEIIPKDQVDNFYFWTPKTNFSLSNYIRQRIQIIQYPLGGYLSYSEGNIIGLDCDKIYYFYYNASTQPGSSGSPIVFDGEDKVFAMHKGTNINKTSNVGIFIGGIIEIMKVYKKNGKYKEYYKNTNLKYDGNFKDDEYDDDNGKYIFENGITYIGQFKNGKKHGNGFLVNKKKEIIKNCEYEYDTETTKEENSNNKTDNKSHQNIKNNGQNSENKKEENKKISENSENNGFNFFGFKISHEDMNFGIKEIHHMLHPLANRVGYICPACEHDSKFHEEINFGEFRCEKCPENNNICYVSL